MLTERAAATLEQEARCASFRDATLYAHKSCARANAAWVAGCASDRRRRSASPPGRAF